MKTAMADESFPIGYSERGLQLVHHVLRKNAVVVAANKQPDRLVIFRRGNASSARRSKPDIPCHQMPLSSLISPASLQCFKIPAAVLVGSPALQSGLFLQRRDNTLRLPRFHAKRLGKTGSRDSGSNTTSRQTDHSSPRVRMSEDT